MNPLLVSEQEPPVLLNPGPTEITGGRQKYEHAWFHAMVEIQGEDIHVLIDPTIAQFDTNWQSDTAVWHKYKLGCIDAVLQYEPIHGCIQGTAAATQIFNNLFAYE